jgi:hypothetical protein
MATAVSRVLESQDAADPEFAAFQQLFGTLAANPSVQLIGIYPLSGIDLWVRLRDDDEDNENAIYTALSAYHSSEGVSAPIDLHVVFAEERDSAYPSSVRVLYRRP